MSVGGEHRSPALEIESPPKPQHNFDVLDESELFWRDTLPLLKEKGYQLRARYQPDWVPSWKGLKGVFSSECEDYYAPMRLNVLDAVRISDGEMVFMKHISRSVFPFERDIVTMLNGEPLKSDPRNHCVPVLDLLDIPDKPDEFILVMPLLRVFDDPRFKTVGEAMEFLRQVFEGLNFMHEHHVAHRDCMHLNIMMDPRPLFADMYHPIKRYKTRDFKSKAKHSRRTKHPVTYYLIDFGLSRQFDPGDTSPREIPIVGGDKSVPEFVGRLDEPRDPFPTDVYYIGNMAREKVLKKIHGHKLDFLLPLVNDMVQDDPEKRPKISEVVARYDKIYRSLHWWTLRSRLVYETGSEESALEKVTRSVYHVARTMVDMLFFRDAMPKPRLRPHEIFKPTLVPS